MNKFRGWPRFSLRTLLVAMTVVSVALAWYVQWVRIEQRAAEAVLAAGGKVFYDWQMRPADVDANFRPDPPGPNCLRTWFGPHWFDSIAKVELSDRRPRNANNKFRLIAPRLMQLPALRELWLWQVELDRADYELLGRMPHLQLLSIGQVAEMTPVDAARLAAARNLRELHLRCTKVSPPALSELARSPRLEKLQISCSSYDRQTGKLIHRFDLYDESAAVIGGFPRLREVLLFGTKITDRGMAELCKLSHLEVLEVGSSRITSASFEPVSRLKKLRHFGARFWQFQDHDIKKLQDAPQLTSLDLATPLLTNASVAEVCKLKQLKRLTLYGYEITDESLAHLRELAELEWLIMFQTSVDQRSSASREFVRALPDCVIVLPPRKTWSDSIPSSVGDGGDRSSSVGRLVER
jgi:hypothetical protein